MSAETPACTVSNVNHVGIAVSNIEEALKTYQALFGSPDTEILEPDFLPLRAAIIVQGDTHIELLQPTDPDSTIGRFIARHGEGLHHFALNVDNVAAKVEQLKASGIQMVDQEPRRGLTGSIAFIHPDSTHGALIELVQPPEAHT
jgi:methylmalonyl-CoA/ethylmalonyl-CoA epimerase